MTKKKPTKKRATKRTSRVPKGKMRLRIAVGVDEYGATYSVALKSRDDPATELDMETGCGHLVAIYVFTKIVDKPKLLVPVDIDMDEER